MPSDAEEIRKLGSTRLASWSTLTSLSGQRPPLMGYRPSCRSCRHCTPPSGVEMGWCQLRRLAIHADLASDLWCHHWTAPAVGLPLVHAGEPIQRATQDRQLALVDLLN